MREVWDEDVPQVLDIERAVYRDPYTTREYHSELAKTSAICLLAVKCREDAPRRSETEHGSRPAAFGRVRQGRPRSLAACTVHRTLDVVDPRQAVHGWMRRRCGLELQRVAGCIGMHLRDGSLLVVTVAVRPELEGQGLGQFMLLECFRLASVTERYAVTLEVRSSNARARRLYQRFGFEETGLCSGYYEDGEDAVAMRSRDLRDAAVRTLLNSRRDEHAHRFPSTRWIAATMEPVTIERTA